MSEPPGSFIDKAAGQLDPSNAAPRSSVELGGKEDDGTDGTRLTEQSATETKTVQSGPEETVTDQGAPRVWEELLLYGILLFFGYFALWAVFQRKAEPREEVTTPALAEGGAESC